MLIINKLPGETALAAGLGTRRMFRTCILCIGLLVSATPAHAQLDKLLKDVGIGSQAGLSDSRAAAGLKEALRVGAESAVNLTGRTDGFFRNKAIKILMPEKLRTLEKGLRAVGYGPEVDQFVLSMNRSAEAAAPAARKIFVDAIAGMTIQDARKILSGGDTAATDYFRSKTSDQLAAAFRPYVEKTMAENKVTQRYKALTGRYQAVPFAKSQDLDIDDYVVAKALDGLFHELGNQERQIRRDPAARTTALLKEVFGR